MSATVNGYNALSVRVRKPRISAAHIDVEIDSEVTLINPVTVLVDGHALVCSVVTQHTFCGRTTAFLVGGKGGLSKVVTAQHFNDSSPKTIITEILREAGETVDASSYFPGTQFGNWQRRQGKASHALQAVADKCGLVWRSTDAGNIWIGIDSYAPVTTDVVVIDEDWDTGTLTIAADSFSELAKIVPGCAFEGHKIEQVTHIVTPGSIRTVASVDSLEGSLNSFLSAIRAASASYGAYRCKVIAQNQDGTLQLKPEDETIAGRGLDKVPIREGAPGWKTKVSGGAIVSVAFDGGQWDRPYACLWGEGQSSGVESMEFLPSGRGAPAAAISDQLEIALPISLPLVGTVGGAPFAGTLTATTPLIGIITGPGNPKLLI
jgi:hypothetical protein